MNTKEQQVLEQLKQTYEESEARELIRLVKNFDKYVLRLKNKMNKILNKSGYEVITGFAVREIDKEKMNGN